MIGAAGGWAGGMAEAEQIATMLVSMVHDLVRDVLSQIVADMIVFVAELVISLGLATPLVIEQCATRVASISERVGGKLTKLTTSLERLSGKTGELSRLFDRAGTNLDRLASGQAGDIRPGRGGGSATGSHVSGTRTPPTGRDIDGWLGDINPHYNPHGPRSRWNSNCGSCAARTHDALAGGRPKGAWPWTKSTRGMERYTGQPQIPSTPSDIAADLRAAGPGSHAVVGIDRADGEAGHWFNAYFDGTDVWYVDGQIGARGKWPPTNLGNVINWDASVFPWGG